MAIRLGLAAMLVGLWLADRGEVDAANRVSEGGWVAPWIGLMVAALGLGVRRWCCRAAKKGRTGSRLERLVLLVLLAGSISLLMHARWSERIRAARVDEERAWHLVEADPSAIRRIEATIATRRGSAFGETWLLERVVAVDDGAPVPRRLLLRSDALLVGGRMQGEAAARLDALAVPGERVRLGVRIRPLLSLRQPGERGREHADHGIGIGAEARLVDPAWVVAMEPRSGAARASGGRHALRRILMEQVSPYTDGAGVGLIAAIALGDRRALEPDLTRALQRLGLLHLVAISGLHVGWLGLGFVWGLGRLGRLGRGAGRMSRLGHKKRSADLFPILAPALIAVAWGYGWLSGASPSVQRAALIITLATAARALLRPIAPANALAVAALILIAFEPSLLFDLGAQLSFAACAGLVALGPPSSVAIRRPRRWSALAVEILSGSIAVGLVTAPLIPALGEPVPPWAPFVNVLAIPVFSLLVLPLAFLMLLAALLRLEGLLRPGLRLAGGLEDTVLRLAEGLPDPGLWDDLAPTFGGVAVPILIVTVIASLGMLRSGWLGAALMGWGLTSCLASIPPLLADLPVSRPRVVFLDVGQGDAALLQGRHADLLIDTGGGRPGPGAGQRLERDLRRLGVGRLELLVVSHGDWDHRGGALRLLERMDVGLLALPAAAREDPTLAALEAVALGRGTQVLWMSSGDRRSFSGEIEVEALWPPEVVNSGDLEIGEKQRSLRRNDRSLVLRISLGGLDYLFAADVGQRVERELTASGREIRADVLKVGHHGSRGSTGPAFLEAVAPTLLVLSAPCLATRGLPDPGRVAQFAARDGSMAWTGRDGPIFVGRDPVSAGPLWRTDHARRACPIRSDTSVDRRPLIDGVASSGPKTPGADPR